MNRRNFLKILGLAPVITALPAIGSIPQILQLYTPLVEDPFAAEGSSIATIPLRLTFAHNSIKHIIETLMPCTTRPNSTSVGYFPIYKKLGFEVNDEIRLLSIEANSRIILDQVLKAPHITDSWTEIHSLPGGIHLGAGHTLTLDWSNNPLLFASTNI